MKKTILALFALILSVLLSGAISAAGQAKQAKIQTRKVKLSDFTTKTTKVVLCGGQLFDNALQEEMARRWLVSPYEFCTLAEYEKLKSSPDYYFLIPASTKSKKEAEPGIVTLTLLKGGLEKSEDPEKVGFDVISIPCASTEAPSGREFVFMPAFLDIIQRFMNEAMTSDRVSYGGLSAYSRKLLRDTGKKLVFSEDDFAEGTKQDPSWKDAGIEIMDEDDADELFNQGAPDTMVSYVVAPSDPKKGAVCYKMVISADTHELCYFEKHTIKGGAPAGFLPFDMKIISLQRKK